MCALELLLLFNIFIFVNLVFWDYIIPKTPFSSTCSLTIEIENIWLLVSSLSLISLASFLVCNRIKVLETTSLSWLGVSTGRSSRVEERLWAYSWRVLFTRIFTIPGSPKYNSMKKRVSLEPTANANLRLDHFTDVTHPPKPVR